MSLSVYLNQQNLKCINPWVRHVKLRQSRLKDIGFIWILTSSMSRRKEIHRSRYQDCNNILKQTEFSCKLVQQETTRYQTRFSLKTNRCRRNIQTLTSIKKRHSVSFRATSSKLHSKMFPSEFSK